jgi:hypothetical protein
MEKNDFEVLNFEVLMDGSKWFSRVCMCLEVLIVSHPGQKCIELVAYNAEIGVEAPRIYISSVLLAMKVISEVNSDRTEFEEKLSAQKEKLSAQKKTCTDADLSKLVYDELMVSYITRRLNIVTKGIDLAKELRVQLSPIRKRDEFSSLCGWQDDKSQDVICERPASLHPIKKQLVQTIRLAEVFAMAEKTRVEEKRRLALTYSVARLRWVTHIGTVMVRNYIKQVKTRLLNSNHAASYKAVEEQRVARSQATVEEGTSSNSDQSQVRQTPTISLDPMERRRQAKAQLEREGGSSKLGKLDCTPKSVLLPPLAVKTTPLHKVKTSPLLKSPSELVWASELNRLRTSNAMSASELERILLPHLALQAESIVAPELGPVKSPNRRRPIH